MQTMRLFFALIRISRPLNVVIGAAAVALGYWLSRSTAGVRSAVNLALAAACAMAFGNVINDIRDIVSDRISHPDRPLPRGDLEPPAAWLWAGVLCAAALSAGFAVSAAAGIATLAPIALLTAYGLWLKRTPLAGNVTVSALIAYPILYGASGAPRLSALFAPAACAFLLNLLREIVKDLQDETGDRDAGFTTTARLPRGAVRSLMLVVAGAYLPVLPLPYLLGHFGRVYLAAALAVVLPLHAVIVVLLAGKRWEQRLGPLSRLLKIEMVAGLAALMIDRIASA